MDLLHKFLNIVLLPLTLIVLLFFMPPFLILKFLWSLKRSVYSENVSGKVILITGASSGIGEHVAYEYAKRGARLALVARREDRLQAVADKARKLGSPEVVVVRADVSKVEECERIVNETVNHFGHLHSTHYAVPHLRKSKGKIVVIASAAQWFTTPGLSFYNASKAAQVSFFETLRTEFGQDIGITIVTPGVIESEMTQEFLPKCDSALGGEMVKARVRVKEPHPLQKPWVSSRFRMGRSGQRRQRLETFLLLDKARNEPLLPSTKIRSRWRSQQIFSATALGLPSGAVCYAVRAWTSHHWMRWTEFIWENWSSAQFREPFLVPLTCWEVFAPPVSLYSLFIVVFFLLNEVPRVGTCPISPSLQLLGVVVRTKKYGRVMHKALNAIMATFPLNTFVVLFCFNTFPAPRDDRECHYRWQVQVNWMPAETTKGCAKAILDSTCSGDKYLIEPSWMKATFWIKILCPEVFEWCLRSILVNNIPQTSKDS
uniref:Uncharacterized protein n=1 Tax=Quercus lobata TaxID=97700 RepID=A0A7N2M950_QUELO